MQKEIRHQLFFNHPPQDVWEYITNAELMAQWLMNTDFEPIVGCEFQFISKPMLEHNFDGIINCKVLEIIPYKKLSYTWKGGVRSTLNLDSVVTWTLEEKNGGTELLLVHTGFTDVNTTMYAMMNAGWLKNMNKIGELLNKK